MVDILQLGVIKVCCGPVIFLFGIIGIITAIELLSLKGTAVITGDLIMGKFSVEPGARFTGNCKMNGVEKNQQEKKITIIPKKD